MYLGIALIFHPPSPPKTKKHVYICVYIHTTTSNNTMPWTKQKFLYSTPGYFAPLEAGLRDPWGPRPGAAAEAPSTFRKKPSGCRILKFKRVYIYIYIYVLIYFYIHTYLHTYIHTCIHTYILCMYAYVYTYVYVYKYVYFYVYVYTHTHTYIYVHIYIYCCFHDFVRLLHKISTIWGVS